MKKNRLLTIFIACLLTMILLVCCGRKENTRDNGIGSTEFRNYALGVSADGETKVYVHGNVAWFQEEIADKSLEEANCFAVYGDRLYYIEEKIGFETGAVSGENCKLLCCNLEGDVEKTETIFELTGISAMGNLMIQEGCLYVSWLTTEDEVKHMIVDLASGEKRDVQIPDTRRLEALTAKEYYYIEGKEIYCCSFGEDKGKFFCKTEGEIYSIYKNGDFLCAITGNDGEIFMEQFGEDGKAKQCYQGLEQVGTDFLGEYPGFVKAEGDILFYEMNGKINEGNANTFLVRMDLETGEKEILGGWYMP